MVGRHWDDKNASRTRSLLSRNESPRTRRERRPMRLEGKTTTGAESTSGVATVASGSAWRSFPGSAAERYPRPFFPTLDLGQRAIAPTFGFLITPPEGKANSGSKETRSTTLRLGLPVRPALHREGHPRRGCGDGEVDFRSQRDRILQAWRSTVALGRPSSRRGGR
jgi:hypothetical protein